MNYGIPSEKVDGGGTKINKTRNLDPNKLKNELIAFSPKPGRPARIPGGRLRLTQLHFANGPTLNPAFYPWTTPDMGGRLSSKTAGLYHNLAYQYDKNGNITQMVDGRAAETQSYSYDGLNRLTNENSPNTPNFTYGAMGNLSAKYASGCRTHPRPRIVSMAR